VADRASQVTQDDGSSGRGKAWSRTAVVAGGVTVVILLALLVLGGIPTPEGLGRVIGLNLFPYVVTALIARSRPRAPEMGPPARTVCGALCGVPLHKPTRRDESLTTCGLGPSDIRSRSRFGKSPGRM
jgi:hypothetical protein